MKNVFVILLYFSCLSCFNQEKIVDKSKLLGNDIRLFQETPAWNLAKAVNDEDTAAIKREVEINMVSIDYKDERFGHTLLSMAIRNDKYESTKTLLTLGANPNAADKYMGTTPIIYAAKKDDPKYLKLLLSYNGNPNSAEDAPPIEGNTPRNTVLSSAIGYMDNSSLEKVKLLVAAGADVNSDNKGRTSKPLNDAFMAGKMDVALYLMEHGADYRSLMYTMVDGEEVYILKALRKATFDLNSEEYKQKLKVIAFLKAKGLDYDDEPIPDYILNEIKEKYPYNWKDYLGKY
ncbi:ankyrin repeat domain-containing protein [Flavobacterium sp.]|uniref:ankyrin repeat domain-containing protein n=1 Tax=Flavobacterium sp. TaxID=239 RepID=UPI0039E6DDFE